jgi:hypothetical protein
MTARWLTALQLNPLPRLLDWQDEALTYFVKRDLAGKQRGPIETLWDLPEALRLARAQGEDGAWIYPSKSIDPVTGTNYYLIETYRNLRVLVETYGYNRQNPAIERAAEFLFSYQTEEGDLRGIIGNQYMPYYHGAILELLIKAGYAEDQCVKLGLDWLLSMRQDDGGWIIPAMAVPPKARTSDFWLGPPLPPDRSLPHAHMATGMVLRAFAFHPRYQHRPEVIAAGEALKSRFFKPDKYNDRKAKSYWLKFKYPFWWSNLLTALDTLWHLGFDKEDADIASGLDWFITQQEEGGLWPTGYGSGSKSEANRHWVGLAICRVLKQYYEV